MRFVRDYTQQLLVHELSGKLSREDVDDVFKKLGFPCDIRRAINALRERIALRHKSAGEAV